MPLIRCLQTTPLIKEPWCKKPLSCKPCKLLLTDSVCDLVVLAPWRSRSIFYPSVSQCFGFLKVHRGVFVLSPVSWPHWCLARCLDIGPILQNTCKLVKQLFCFACMLGKLDSDWSNLVKKKSKIQTTKTCNLNIGDSFTKVEVLIELVQSIIIKIKFKINLTAESLARWQALTIISAWN